MIYIDFETRSECDLKKCGAWVYSKHPSTEVICMAYVNGFLRPPSLWLPGDEIPSLLSPENIRVFGPVEAHNVFFEKSIWENIMVKKYGWPPIADDQWACSASLAAAQAIPRSLDKATKAMRLSERKDDAGHKLMLKMCKPKKDGTYHEDPVEMLNLYEYCKQDVVAERALSKALRPLSDYERRVWLLDQKINRRGIRIDVEAAVAAKRLGEWFQEENNKPLPDLTRGVITKATQRQRIVDFLKRKGFKTPEGDEIESLSKESVEQYLTYAKGTVKEVLEIRLMLAKSSVAKYSKMLTAVDMEDGRMRDMLMYHGASTGRWTGKLVQPHNFPQNKYCYRGKKLKPRCLTEFFDILKASTNEEFEMVFPNVMDTLSNTIRGIFIPTEGKRFYGGDFSAIEARVVLWLAGDEVALQVFRDGGDIYKALASTIYNQPADSFSKDSEERQLGKQGILGCGFGIGWKTFQATCESYKIFISEEVAKLVVKSYRDKYYKVVQLWADQENTALMAMRGKGAFRNGKIAWARRGKFLYAKLPSGRYLSYCDPRVEKKKTPWGQMKDCITYMTLKDGHWIRTSTYGGKLVENLTQAVARDLMAHGMLACEEAGYEILLTVHDEILSEKESGTTGEFEALMSSPTEWGSDIPVGVEGWEGARYLK